MKLDDKILFEKTFRFGVPAIILLCALASGGTDAELKDFLSAAFWAMALLVTVNTKIFPRKLPKLPAIGWIGFLLTGMLTIFVAKSPEGVVKFATQMGGLLAFGWVVYQLCEHDIRIFLRAVYAGFAMIVIIGFMYILAAKFGFFLGTHDQLVTFISTFYWKNPAAGYIILFLPLAAALAFVDESKAWRIFYTICAIAGISALILTRSRGAYLAVTVSVLFTMALNFQQFLRHWKKLSLILALGIAFSFVVMPPSFILDRFMKVSEIAKSAEETEQPMQERRLMLSMGKSIWCDHPLLGVGMGGFLTVYPSYLENSHYLSTHLHNQYLQYLVEGGIIVGGFFAFAVIISFVGIFLFARKRADLLLLGLITGIGAYLLHIGIDFDWDFWGTTIPFIAFMSIGLRQISNNTEKILSPRTKVLTATLLSCAIIVSLAFSLANTIHDRYIIATAPKDQLKYINIAAKLNPFSTRYLYEKALALYSVGEKEKYRQPLERAFKLEPDNSTIAYEKAYLVLQNDTSAALDLMYSTARRTRFIMPKRQLDLANLLVDRGDTARARTIVKALVENFSGEERTHYSEKTANVRYILARAYATFAEIEEKAGRDFVAAQLQCKSMELGCPRYRDRLAAVWGIDTPTPEWVIGQLIDAANMRDSSRFTNLTLNNSQPITLKDSSEVHLFRIMDVRINMLEETAAVDAILLRYDNGEVFTEIGFFNLQLTEKGWKAVF